ncbi:MAG: methylmalonyl Co-A mutase-associated GTPase MeaB [Thaumarchaeota archaeon]|nr:methylmalonyl Co-A mutase-associated GTPase MeaB [Candidatus Geocrenenecus arthurdayi]MCL7390996.1 methylmalonyl Co-A mutase-associated GTPase MeaB [Candidatus Geocrenenecus arthurdayi]
MIEEYIYEYIEKAKKNDKGSIGRLLTFLESSPSQAFKVLNIILRNNVGKAHVIGFTGIPGSGKSTLISKLIHQYIKDNHKIAVIAIDPTSPLSRGAFLGDRIRMQEHSLNPNVFIRSVSTRGLKGGLSFAGVAMVELFDYLGYDKIFIETVGVGQAETDIMNIAHTVIVATMPGVGDEIQVLKAGVMEIADIYVLNKSDKEESLKTFEYLNFIIESEEIGSRVGWKPRLLKTSALMGQGIQELRKAIEEHLEYCTSQGYFNHKINLRRKTLVKLFLEKTLLDKLSEEFEELKSMDIEDFSSQLDILRKKIENFLREFDKYT